MSQTNQNDSGAGARLGLPSGLPTPDLEAFGKTRKKGLSQSVVLALVLGVSAASLFGMRHLGSRSGMDMTIKGDTPQVRAAAATGINDAKYERIMADLQRIQQPLDLALVDFKKSPFMRPPKRRLAEDPHAPDAPDVDAATERRLSALNATFDKLALQSVLGGSTPVARINTKMFRVGDVVEDTFTITKIDGRSVELTADGLNFVLNMEAHSKKNAAPKSTGGRR